MDKAAAGGHFEVILFLHTKRSDGCTMDAAANANRNEHVEILQWFFHFYSRMIHREKISSSPSGTTTTSSIGYIATTRHQGSGQCVLVLVFNLPTSRSTCQIEAQECVSFLP
ncbi:hypothetical protein JG687_00011865 [Phytophthora cactorum]|uniref:Uncharacterized protein n=1 Tax=Phytophthora cactorum TaxID=29920 RepID=A0A8T1KNC9_9STRA|nr:hypothetical protein C6341_g6879 [Phytophthora cactorum]KAG4054287.1 hypothetical protein PC123_g10597 [Phytophthora cactorum]KAG4237032.1 hypothetical protein PC116_g14904 [Phytophthora cactorum]KAG6954323.1 hypothetical protein JG687_00011865 [Phytophthora cactorum]